jgi:hypothetical protein
MCGAVSPYNYSIIIITKIGGANPKLFASWETVPQDA